MRTERRKTRFERGGTLARFLLGRARFFRRGSRVPRHRHFKASNYRQGRQYRERSVRITLTSALPPCCGLNLGFATGRGSRCHFPRSDTSRVPQRQNKIYFAQLVEVTRLSRNEKVRQLPINHVPSHPDAECFHPSDWKLKTLRFHQIRFRSGHRDRCGDYAQLSRHGYLWREFIACHTTRFVQRIVPQAVLAELDLDSVS